MLGNRLDHYWKALIAAVPVVVFVGTAVVQAVQGENLGMADFLRIALVAAAAFGVYQKANAPHPTAE